MNPQQLADALNCHAQAFEEHRQAKEQAEVIRKALAGNPFYNCSPHYTPRQSQEANAVMIRAAQRRAAAAIILKAARKVFNASAANTTEKA